MRLRMMAAAFTLAWTTSSSAQADLEPGRRLTRMFYADSIDAVWSRMTPQMQQALGSRDALAAFRARVASSIGEETAVVAERVAEDRGLRVYRRQARYSRFGGLIVVQWAMQGDSVAGFMIAPDQGAPQAAAPSRYLDYQTRTALHLPFARPVYVVWGGREVAQNYHAVDANQRFAYDLLTVRDGATHTGDGHRNEDYFCFGEPVLAPAPGTVVSVVEGIADNVPGHMNAAQIAGNHIVLDHGQGEYSVLAHLRMGSIRVRPGQRVRQGEALGQCGNSGNSSEPHLHFQLQEGPAFGTSAGMPAQFRDYLANGQRVARGEPVRGQSIAPADH
jgi:murein DD-endopeptidase MepM/ murein hydrolase activator NlpD